MSQSEQAVAEQQQQPEQSLMSSVEVSNETNDEIGNESIPHMDNVEGEDEGPYERPDWMPEKFWAEDGPDLEAMANSYQELEQKFHQGKHKAPEKYDTKVLEDFGLSDDPLANFYTDWAKNNGISQAAFEDLAQQFLSSADAQNQNYQVEIAQEKKALGANADEIIQSNIQWADSLVQKGIISQEERGELDIWGGTAAGQRLMQKMRAMQGDMVQIPTNLADSPAQSEDDFKTEMRSKMADPRYGSDPAYTRGVEREFEQRYR